MSRVYESFKYYIDGRRKNSEILTFGYSLNKCQILDEKRNEQQAQEEMK